MFDSIKIPLKTILNILMIMLALLLHYTFVPEFSINGARPHLPLVMVIVTGIASGSVYGGAAGFITGLYQDAMTGKILGMYALFGLYSGALAGIFSNRRKNESVLAVIFITYFVSVFFESCSYFFGYVIPIVRNGGEAAAGIAHAFARIIVPEAMMNTLIGAPIFLILRGKTVRDSGDDDLNVPEIY